MTEELTNAPSPAPEPSAFTLTADPWFCKRSSALLLISSGLSLCSLCTSLPFLGATSLFQTPFLSLSSFAFNKSLWEKKTTIPPNHEQAPANDVVLEDSDSTPLLPVPTSDRTIWLVGWKEVEGARALALRWTLNSVIVIALCSGLTYVSAVPAPGSSAGRRVSPWLYVAWAEAIVDALQACTMGLMTRACLRELRRVSVEYRRIHPEALCTLGEDPRVELA